MKKSQPLISRHPMNSEDTVALTSEQLVSRIRHGEPELFEVVMRRHNQRLFRVARCILGSEDEAQDAMQESYLRAFTRLDQLREGGQLANWLTKIVVHEARGRNRRRWRSRGMTDLEQIDQFPSPENENSIPKPEREVGRGELRRLLTRAVDRLPENYRTVFVLREVEGLKTADTAECLDISPESVRIRLHRARAILRRDIEKQFGGIETGLFVFHRPRCDRVVEWVLASLFHTSYPFEPKSEEETS